MSKLTFALFATFSLLSSRSAVAQTRPLVDRLGKTGTSHEEVLRNAGTKPAREYTVTAIEGQIDPFLGPQSPAQRLAAGVRARELDLPTREVTVTEWQDGAETVRAVFDEGALRYGTSTVGTGITAASLAAEYGPPKIASIARWVGTALQVFTVFAYPDRGVAWIGAGSTPPFIPSGTFPSIPTSNVTLSTLPHSPADIPVVARITLPPNTVPADLDGVVLEDAPDDAADDVADAETADPTPEPAATPAATPAPKKPLVKPPVKKPVAGPWRSPLATTCITSGYGSRNTGIKGATKVHLANDLRASCGTQVKAARGGTVTWAQWTDGYGYQIRIDHGDGTETRYCHLQKGGFKVKAQQTVEAGQLIALSGNTSTLNTMNKKPLACHLHFEVLVHGKKVNPSSYVRFARCGARSSGNRNANFYRP